MLSVIISFVNLGNGAENKSAHPSCAVPCDVSKPTHSLPQDRHSAELIIVHWKLDTTHSVLNSLNLTDVKSEKYRVIYSEIQLQMSQDTVNSWNES